MEDVRKMKTIASCLKEKSKIEVGLE